MQRGCDLAALPPTPRQVGQEQIELAGTLARRAQQIGGPRDTGEAANRLAIKVQVASDGADGEPLPQQRVDPGVPPPGPRRQPSRARRRQQLARGQPAGCGLAVLQVTLPPGQGPDRESLEGVGQVVYQVPALGHLQGAGGAARGPGGVHPISIAADHLDTRVMAEPGRQRVGRGIFQQIDRPMGVDIDQDRAVPMAATQSKLIDPEHARRRDRRFR
jgi:hypothetical protein